MKSNKLIRTLGLAVVLGMSAGAFAYGNNDHRGGFEGAAFHKHPVFQESLRLMKNVNERQDKQLEHILKGFYERQITPQEFRKLMDEQRDIRSLERKFLADGVLTRFEYQKLDTALNAANRNLQKELNDGRGRPSHGSGYGYR